MPHELLYAKSLSLLLEEVESASDLTMVRSGLLRVRRFSRSHGLTVSLTDGRLIVHDMKLSRPVPALNRLTTAMTMHGVGQITLNAGAVPRELLKLAMLLVRRPATSPDTPSIFEELREASLWYVQCYPTPRASEPEKPKSFDVDVALESAGAIMARGQEMAQTVAAAVRADDMTELISVLASIVAIEEVITHKELRAAWTAVYEQAATRDALRTLVHALPGCGDAIASAIAVLRRSGDVAAEILIEELLVSDSIEARRACFDALVEVQPGTARLATLLQHEHWFVARNAACLLGQLQSTTSEPELIDALTHSDERVRASVVSALLQLDTPTSRATVRGAIRDAAPEVRRRAVRGFLAEKGTWTNVERLLQALERETELDVQIEFLYALGTLATPDAVQKLIRLCTYDGRNRPPDFRIAAAEALASARLAASVPMLRTMLKDPDQHARAAARHLIRAVS
ncbi:MAG: HEAT repeat domain-containing protein [Gemmatimonadaceae bacterium]|nr:HEAT repeat domain-containing protein [Gemmatimonadaceae bacterium]